MNAQHFKDIETSVLQLRKFFLNTLHRWIAAYHSLSAFTYVDFLNLSSVPTY
jgi:hypothetical protein